MPACAAVNCSNRSEKGVKVFKLPHGPRNEVRRNIWLHNVNRGGVLPNNFYLCENHFTEDQFEMHRADKKRFLRWNAVPTVFTRGTPRYSETCTTTPLQNHADKDNNNILGKNISQDDAVGLGVADEVIRLQLKLQKAQITRIKLIKAQRLIRGLQTEKTNLFKHMHRMFNEDQLVCMANGNMRGNKWKSATIKNALKLYVACGIDGYEELLRQSYPLPSIRTLQRHFKNFHAKCGISDDATVCLKCKADTWRAEDKTVSQNIHIDPDLVLQDHDYLASAAGSILRPFHSSLMYQYHNIS